MRRLNVLAEGQTEEGFVRTVLAPHLAGFNVVVNVRTIITGKTRPYQKDGKRLNTWHKGGLLSHRQAVTDLQRWRNEDKQAILTTMFDLYALPNDFPDFEVAKTKPPIEQVEWLEPAFQRELNIPNFVPYFQLHEFEALLFSDIQILNDYVAIDSETPEQSLVKLQTIRDEFENPEFINNSPLTTPSKHLDSIYGNIYQKPLHGRLIAEEIGLNHIRSECPHFNAWLGKLEALNAS